MIVDDYQLLLLRDHPVLSAATLAPGALERERAVAERSVECAWSGSCNWRM